MNIKGAYYIYYVFAVFKFVNQRFSFKDINQGKGTIGLLIHDTIMAKDLKQTMNYLKLTGKETSEAVIKLNNLMTSLDKKGNVVGVLKDTVVANKIKNAATNLEKSSNNLNSAILNLKDGKGAINYLSNDPKLVQKIDSTMTNIKEASKRLDENMEALKHNFLFRGYFKKQEKAKLKGKKK